MKKEVLTKEGIITDIKNNGYTRKGSSIYVILAVVLFLLSFIFLLPVFFGKPVSPDLVFELLFFLIFSVIFIIFEIRGAKKQRSLSEPDYYIVKDKLVKVSEDDFAPINKRDSHGSYVDILYFENFGNYIVTYNNYLWSKEFYMSAQGLVNTSVCGDEFYLVIAKTEKKEILFVYNTKFFELDEELEYILRTE